MGEEALRVPSTRHGWPLEEFLADLLSEAPPVAIRRMLVGGRVLVNGRAGWLGQRLAMGDAVAFEPDEVDASRPAASPRIVLEREGFVVVSKPAGLPTVPERKPTGASLVDLLRERRGEVRWYVVHRLDRDTSGLLVVAKTPEAHRDLSLQFERREVAKEYLALVCGEVDLDEGRIDLPIGHDPRDATRMRPDRRRGRISTTRYEVEERYRDFTLVRVFPETGRTHQVRVHLAGIGHALAVDPTYGSRSILRLSEIKPAYRPKRAGAERPLIDRLTLHARRLTFRAPLSEERLTVEAPAPGDFILVLRMLRKYRPHPRWTAPATEDREE